MFRRLTAGAQESRKLGFSSVVLNAATLIGTNVVSAALGAVFWWVAARSFEVSQVGVAAAAIAATTLLGAVSVLGTGTLLVGELPRSTTVERSNLVATAMTVCGLVGGLLGLLFAFVAPRLSSDFGSLATGLDSAAVLALTVSATAVGGVIDHALIGVLRGELQLWRNTVLATVKLGALVIVAALPIPNRALALYATWLVGTVASFAVVLPLAGFGHLPPAAYRPQRALLERLGWCALQHHALNLSVQLPGLVLPLLVTVLLSAAATAYFYLASMLASFVYMIPVALSTTLYAIGAHQPAALVSKVRLTLALSFAGGICANIFLLVAAAPILSLFGRAYVDEVAWMLRVLLLGVFPVAVKTHYIALSQVKQRVGQAAMVFSLAGVVELVSAAAGASLGGLHGLVVAYVAALCVEAMALTPVVFQAVIGPRVSRIAESQQQRS